MIELFLKLPLIISLSTLVLSTPNGWLRYLFLINLYEILIISLYEVSRTPWVVGPLALGLLTQHRVVQRSFSNQSITLLKPRQAVQRVYPSLLDHRLQSAQNLPAFETEEV